MKDEDYGIGCAILILMGGIALAVALFVHDATDSLWRDDAIKHNKAEFYLDQKNERQWRWKE